MTSFFTYMVVQCTVGKMAGTIQGGKRNDRRAGEKETEKEGRRLLKRDEVVRKVDGLGI
jgi:hypothetical protein